MAWIETCDIEPCSGGHPVATREGGVDRNSASVTPLAAVVIVATREGGVDRNLHTVTQLALDDLSPPARVAWIETGVRRV